MLDRLLIFLSSSIQEFANEREAIQDEIERKIMLSRAWRFESSPADTDPLEESYLKYVRECDIFVLLIGGDISDPVWKEYELATALGKPKLVFVKQGVSRSPRAEALIESREFKWEHFTDIRSLRRKATLGVSKNLIEFHKRFRLSQKEIEQLKSQVANLEYLLQHREHQIKFLGIVAFVTLVFVLGFSSLAFYHSDQSFKATQTAVATQTAIPLQATNIAQKFINESQQTVIARQYAALGTRVPTVVFPPTPVLVDQRPSSSSFGIAVNWTRADHLSEIASVKALGFEYVKAQVNWCDIESIKGTANFSALDSLLRQANGNGIKVLLTVVCAPSWTRTNYATEGNGPPDNAQEIADFTGRLADRYCDDGLGAIEVWNEQNLISEWQGIPISAALYMDLLRLSYRSIKANCPSIVVVSGAPFPTGVNSDTSSDDVLFLQQMYGLGLKEYSDAIGAHPLGYVNPPDVPAGNFNLLNKYQGHRSFYFRGTLDSYRAVMIQWGDVKKQIWLTGFGWGVDSDPKPGYEYTGYVSLEQQAQWLVKAFQWTRAQGWVGPAFVSNLDFTDMNSGLGAFHVIGRPAYGALMKMPK